MSKYSRVCFWSHCIFVLILYAVIWVYLLFLFVSSLCFLYGEIRNVDNISYTLAIFTMTPIIIAYLLLVVMFSVTTHAGVSDLRHEYRKLQAKIEEK